ncbi:D-isomer specific 2-hydroxyacid dehydrogenase [Cercophora newfieldiana]|uniref:D-isomer specific 2-hydroxyacid dehydrogenase n=1 Tax=Cercophora newfieldiana TaxID=92897 RepID=A0AA40CK77_9PEZI|nr:D-isomer specific 2-hydroxyacid dehydrogenase [Cercophora newfieldiana]
MASSANGSRSKVLLLGEIELAHSSWSAIASLADVITPAATSRDAFIAESLSGAFEGCSVAYRTFASFSITGKIDGELLDALPPSLRFICHNGAGYDQVDVPACTARGIRVSNTPTAVDDATADMGIFLLLGALRNLAPSIASLRAGEWRGKTPPALGHDPQGKVLGILGMGGIGRNMAKKAKVFGMEIRYYNRTKLDADVEQDIGAEWVDIETLLKESDVLSLNLPLNPNTRHIISTKEFAKMKRGITIVNTARGAVMDEAALVEALKSGQVGSAGLDVYEFEPDVHPGLIENPRCFLVPHMGTHTVETETKMEEWAISNVRMAIESGVLRSVVPEQRSL